MNQQRVALQHYGGVWHKTTPCTLFTLNESLHVHVRKTLFSMVQYGMGDI